MKLAVMAHQKAEYKLATLLWTLHSKRLYRERGCSSTVQYGEVELDLPARKTKDLVAIGKRLPEMPRLAERFAEGALAYTKVREVIRIATPETHEAWTERALRSSSRELEEQVAACRRGDLPPAPSDLPLKPSRGRMVFDTDVVNVEVVRRALAALRQQGELDEDTDDGALLAEMARRFIAEMPAGAPISAERFRVVVTRCADCEKSHVGPHEASEAVRAQAECDAEVVDLTRPDRPLTRHVPLSTRRVVESRDGHHCVVPYCRNHAWLDVHHIQARAHGGGHDTANLTCLCPMHHDLIHRGLLLLTRTDEGIRFYFPDGTPFGPSHTDDSPEIQRPAMAEAVLRLLDAGPLYDHAIEDELRLTPGRATRLLSMLRAQAEVIQTTTGEWARVDRFVCPAPTWVARAAGSIADSA